MIAGNRAVRFGSFGVRFCSVGMPAAVWFSLVASLQAAPPPLREQVSLNGQWLYAPRGAAPTTRNVPGENGDLQEAANDSGSHFKGFGFDGTDSAWYERIAVVPAAWAGKRIMFESDYVGHVVEVYVGDRLAGTHVGMALPFRIDVTELVTPGAEVRIRVRVWDRSKEPVHVGENSSGAPRYFWPNASWNNGCQWYGDVWLRAYGQVHLAETFIQTSWRQGKIAVDYEIANTTGNDRTVRIEAVAKRTVAELSFAGEPTLVKAGHKAKMRVEKPWKNAALWNAETPNLYQLESAVRDVADQSVLDCESRRFGFREFWIEKNQYVLNGVRLNLRGDAGSGVQPRASRDDFALLIDTLKEHNLNVIKPVWDTYPIWILDLADEKGIYVMQEVAFGASGDGTYADFDQVQTNVEKYNHIGIRAWRNHPSVVIWSFPWSFGAGSTSSSRANSRNWARRPWIWTRPGP